jgi:D-tyrosyl-tRNA(Tyr) deacylase
MRAVVQRVSRASVTVDGVITGKIAEGLVILLGVSGEDDLENADVLTEKIVNLRIFGDVDGKMNLSLLDVRGELLVISQFTLFADTSRGRRPSFIKAAAGERANELYEYFVGLLKNRDLTVETGVFGAMMDVELINSGPVTIILDTDDWK